MSVSPFSDMEIFRGEKTGDRRQETEFRSYRSSGVAECGSNTVWVREFWEDTLTFQLVSHPDS
jgi:hypothetical protein